MSAVAPLRIPTPELSLMEEIALLLPDEREWAIEQTLTEHALEAAEDLKYIWPLWARPKQLPPSEEWVTWLIRSGRGSGKTRCGAEWIIQRAKDGHGPIALIAQTKADARDTMIELGESSILKIASPDFYPEYEPSKRRLTFPNGVTASVYSGDEPDQLRGPQHATVWSDELCKWRYPQEAFDNTIFGLRVGNDPKHLITTTPRPIPLLTEIIADPTTIEVTGSTFENISHLSSVFINTVLRKYQGTRLGLQELHGVILQDRPGALWDLDVLEENRVRTAPELVRVAVGVDPKTSAEANSETGIIVAGITASKHAYILGDYSIDGSPQVWASQVLKGYNTHEADVIVAEINQGGDMVPNTIHTMRDEEDRPIGESLKVFPVRASRGKQTRAEPISLLYSQGRVHHLGYLPELEDQMVSWVPGESASPDRVDALVWVLSALMLPQKAPGRSKKRKRRPLRRR